MENSDNIEEIENDKMSYQSIKLVAAFLFILGLIIGLVIYSDFIHRDNPKLSFYFDMKNGLPDLADSLLGTTGLCWSLAGTLLFFYTILQTRQEMNLQIKEMKQTNTSLIGQKQQTTFFNLLENHTRLINTLYFDGEVGHIGITNFSKKLSDEYDKYFLQMSLGVFSNYRITSYHPYNRLKENRSSIDSYLSNLNSLLYFVQNKLEEKEFYFDLISNYLSVGEKFLIGASINAHSNRETFLISQIKNHQYKFCNEYYLNENRFIIDRYLHFPFVNIKSKIHGFTKLPKNDILESDDIFNYEILINNNVYGDRVRIVRYRLINNINGNVNNPEVLFTSTDLEKDEFYYNSINVNNIIKEFIVKNPYGTYFLCLEFTFDLKGGVFKIKDEFKIIIGANPNDPFSLLDYVTIASNITNY